METTVKILDHGYLKFVEHWGSDERIIESARMSTAKGFQGWGPRCKSCKSFLGDRKECPKCVDVAEPGDEKLLRFLWENHHSTPFEMAGLTIEVKAPIMVFREWHRHRVPFGYNEMCLTGDTEITCIGSGGLVRHYTIEHIFKTKHVGVVDHHLARDPLPSGVTRNGYSKAGTPMLRERRSRGQSEAFRVRKLPSCQSRTLRVLDEENEVYMTAPMLDVWEAGVKDVFLVKTRNGHSIKASANGVCPTCREIRPGTVTYVQEAVTGMALGVDQWFAEVCLVLGVPFTAAVPCDDQERLWPEESQRHYRELLAKAHHVRVVSPGTYAPWKMQARNEFMVNECDVLLAVWDGSPGGTANCVRYAEQVGKPVWRIDPRR